MNRKKYVIEEGVDKKNTALPHKLAKEVANLSCDDMADFFVAFQIRIAARVMIDPVFADFDLSAAILEKGGFIGVKPQAEA